MFVFRSLFLPSGHRKDHLHFSMLTEIISMMSSFLSAASEGMRFKAQQNTDFAKQRISWNLVFCFTISKSNNKSLMSSGITKQI